MSRLSIRKPADRRIPAVCPCCMCQEPPHEKGLQFDVGGFALSYVIASVPAVWFLNRLNPQSYPARFIICGSFVFFVHLSFAFFGDSSTTAASLSFIFSGIAATALWNALLGVFFWPFFARLVSVRERDLSLAYSE